MSFAISRLWTNPLVPTLIPNVVAVFVSPSTAEPSETKTERVRTSLQRKAIITSSCRFWARRRPSRAGSNGGAFAVCSARNVMNLAVMAGKVRCKRAVTKDKQDSKPIAQSTNVKRETIKDHLKQSITQRK